MSDLANAPRTTLIEKIKNHLVLLSVSLALIGVVIGGYGLQHSNAQNAESLAKVEAVSVENAKLITQLQQTQATLDALIRQIPIDNCNIRNAGKANTRDVILGLIPVDSPHTPELDALIKNINDSYKPDDCSKAAPGVVPPPVAEVP